MNISLPTNSSSTTPRKRRSSTNDTRVVHPYVVQERQKMIANNDSRPWFTSKIIRKNGNVTVHKIQL